MLVSGNDATKVLDISDWSKNNGGNLQIYHKNNTANQRFYLERLSSGYYSLKVLDSGRYLHTADERQTVSNVHQWAGNSHKNAQWQLVDAGNGYFYLKNRSNGSYLDNSYGRAVAKNNVITHPFNGSNAQKWKFLSTSDGSDERQVLLDGWYEVQSGNNNAYVWDVNCAGGQGKQNGANLILYQRNNNPNQRFYLQYLGNGYYAIKAKHSGKYLHKQSGGTVEDVVQWEGCSTAAVQTQWALNKGGGRSLLCKVKGWKLYR